MAIFMLPDSGNSMSVRLEICISLTPTFLKVSIKFEKKLVPVSLKISDNVVHSL